jgi:hypothetical protein
MSFETNDMNTIYLGNYEEFFILYMDNELNEEQRKMVDEFLLAHPDLQAELDVLMSTRLPLEEFSVDKKDLMAESMKQNLIDEELLLYIDNELPADKNKTLELELTSNKSCQLQHHWLLQTKLDPSEKISYPNKKELYHKTGKGISIKVWMRVAAAIVVIALGGVVYFKNPPRTVPANDSHTTADARENPVQQDEIKKSVPVNSVSPSSENKNDGQIAVVQPLKKETRLNQEIQQKRKTEDNITPQSTIAYTPQNAEENETDRFRVRYVQLNGTDNTIPRVAPAVSINKADVTSSLLNRIDNSSGDDEKFFASNDRKGSIKGFLRKATRMIEKRTGIDPTNENGELLIGAVAINLK